MPGTVICQLNDRQAWLDHPQMVKIPGFLIDHVVLEPTRCMTYGTSTTPPAAARPRPGRDDRADPLTEGG